MSQPPCDVAGGLVAAGDTGGDRGSEVAGELGVALVESSQAVADACGDCLACPFAFVAEPARAAGESGGATELVDQGLAFVVELGGSMVVVAVERPVDLFVELGEALAVARLRTLVEDGVGTEASGA